LIGGVVALFVYAVDDFPLVPPGAAVDPTAVARAREILRVNDPRKLARSETRQLTVSAGDLEALLNFAIHRGVHGNAAVTLRDGGAEVLLALPLPANPLGHFVNVVADVGHDADSKPGQLDLHSVHIGRVPLPGPLAGWLISASLKRARLGDEADALARSIARIAIAPDAVHLTYVWNPDILERARALAVNPEQRERFAAAQRKLVAAIAAAGSAHKLPLAAVLGPMLADVGSGGERSQAYRDILFVTAYHLSGEKLSRLIPEAAQWPQPLPVTLTLRGRDDLAQHFTVSAALAAWSGEGLANAIGVEKEMSDSHVGSGFSFIDLTADRSGTRLGELAVNNPERLAAAVSAGISDTSLLPSIDGLPEFMMSAEFQRRFGGVGGAAYTRMTDEIDRRIAALALFR
jgi:hypothetical protein